MGRVNGGERVGTSSRYQVAGRRGYPCVADLYLIESVRENVTSSSVNERTSNIEPDLEVRRDLRPEPDLNWSEFE